MRIYVVDACTLTARVDSALSIYVACRDRERRSEPAMKRIRFAAHTLKALVIAIAITIA